MGIFWLIWLAIVIVVIAGMWKVFTKAGKPGWASIVPIYNLYILLEIVGRPTWWLAFLLLGFIPFIGSLALLVVMFIIYWDVAKSFGKDIGFAIGLMLLGIVFWPMLGFGSAQYVGPMASGFGLPDTPGGGYAGGGYPPPAQGGYAPPQPGYTPPAPGYTPPAPTYTPPAPPAAPPAAPVYTPPAAPAAPPAAPPQAPVYEPPAAPPAAPTYEPPAAPPAPPTPPAPPA
jgi:hypothetical protein